VAHAYTRYLGDLSGGQLLKKIAQRAMNLSSGDGLAFYEFNSISDEQEFKQNYKRAMDSLPLTTDLAEQIVAEANLSFTMNMKMFLLTSAAICHLIIPLIIMLKNFTAIQQ
jgi:heme oxygenase